MSVQHLIQDVGVAWRGLAREKAFTLAALLSLALGIGANTALFSIVYGVLLRPLPYESADRLLRLTEYHPGATSAVSGPLITNFTYHAWKGGSTIEGIASFRSQRFVDTTGPVPVKLPGLSMTPAGFRLLGVKPVAGRVLIDDDEVEGRPSVAVISAGLWRERFASDPSVIGKNLILDGTPHTIVGVTPAGFYFPNRETRVWTAMRVPEGSADPARQSVSFIGAIAKLRPGFTVAQASDEATRAARGVKRPPVVDAVFGKGGPVTVRTDRWIDDLTAKIRPALIAFSAGAVVILLIACSNVASLQLARGVARQREAAVRSALGASRGRLLGQMMTESLLLAGLGGVLGLALGRGLITVLPWVAPPTLPRLDDIALDAAGLVFAFVATAIAGLLSGFLPALRSSVTSLAPALREGAGASATASTLRLRSGLVMMEAALSVLLLVGAGLLVRSFSALLSVDPGYESERVLIAQLDSGPVEADPLATLRLAKDLTERMRAMPGVVAVGASNMAPLDSMTAVRSFELPMEDAPGGKVAGRATAYVTTPGFKDALSLRLKQGRFFVESDSAAGHDPMIVNEEFVRLYLHDGKKTIGRRLPGLVNDKPEMMTEIVGVVQNVLKNGLDQKPLPEMFFLAGAQNHGFSGWFQLVARTTGDPSVLAPTLRTMVREMDKTFMVETATLSSRADASVSQPRFAAQIVTAFAALALTLAAAGLYGALSYSVSQRRRELGVRSALGASRRQIVRLVLRQGLVVVTAGLAVGLLASLVGARYLAPLLFGIGPLDPVAFVVAPLALLTAASVACVLPAWRGASIPPTEALRCE